jgi:hypothetical protein
MFDTACRNNKISAVTAPLHHTLCCRYVVRLGELDLQRDDDGAKPIDILVEGRKVHNDYNPTTFVNDVAILRLQNDVTFSSKFTARHSAWLMFWNVKCLFKNNIFQYNYFI